MKEVARMLRAHRALILNWFRAKGRISSGMVEGFNGKARVITKRAYGFRTRPAMKSPCTIHLETCPNRNSPIDSADEASTSSASPEAVLNLLQVDHPIVATVRLRNAGTRFEEVVDPVTRRRLIPKAMRQRGILTHIPRPDRHPDDLIPGLIRNRDLWIGTPVLRSRRFIARPSYYPSRIVSRTPHASLAFIVAS